MIVSTSTSNTLSSITAALGPTTVTLNSISATPATASSLSAAAIGAIAGSIVAVLVIAIAVTGFVFCYRARLRSRENMLAMTMAGERRVHGATDSGSDKYGEQVPDSDTLRYPDLHVAMTDCGRVDSDQ